MNGLIQELTNELKTNTGINTSLAAHVVLESINNSVLLGIPSEEILENSLTTLERFAEELVNENLKEVVAKFKKLADKTTPSLSNMAKEAGIALKIKAIKESSIYSDPTMKHRIAILEQAVASTPEYRIIDFMFEQLSNFSYDKTVASVLEELSKYVNENRVKLHILNTIFEMRTTGAVLYKDVCSVLEESLLENIQTADALRMKLRTQANLPAVSSLLNNIKLMESKASGEFELGLGNGDATVMPIIAPFYKVSESDALLFIDNRFVKVSENADPVQVSTEVVEEFPEFFEICEAFRSLGFKQVGSSIVSTGRNLTVAFDVNESGSLVLKLNGSAIEDLAKVNFSEVFLMESLERRHALTKVFDNLDVLVNMEFAKTLVNERLGKNSIVLNFGENIFVLEKLGETRTIKKMKGLTFHNYVMENFKYDISDVYSIQLEEREAAIKSLDAQKASIEINLTKLEGSIAKIQEALSDKSMTAEYQEKLNELKRSIEKNVNDLKSQYILIDQTKKKA